MSFMFYIFKYLFFRFPATRVVRSLPRSPLVRARLRCQRTVQTRTTRGQSSLSSLSLSSLSLSSGPTPSLHRAPASPALASEKGHHQQPPPPPSARRTSRWESMIWTSEIWISSWSQSWVVCLITNYFRSCVFVINCHVCMGQVLKSKDASVSRGCIFPRTQSRAGH